MLIFIFCFFKQKTAYEVRISDWSSDVCSSYLIPLAQPLAQSLRRNPSPLRFPILPPDDRSACPNLLACRPPFQDCLQSASAAQPDQAAEADPPVQIGRASCRERV